MTSVDFYEKYRYIARLFYPTDFLELSLIICNVPDVEFTGDPNYVWWLRGNLDNKVQHVEEQSEFSVITGKRDFVCPSLIHLQLEGRS